MVHRILPLVVLFALAGCSSPAPYVECRGVAVQLEARDDLVAHRVIAEASMGLSLALRKPEEPSLVGRRLLDRRFVEKALERARATASKKGDRAALEALGELSPDDVTIRFTTHPFPPEVVRVQDVPDAWVGKAVDVQDPPPLEGKRVAIVVHAQVVAWCSVPTPGFMVAQAIAVGSADPARIGFPVTRAVADEAAPAIADYLCDVAALLGERAERLPR